MIEKKEVPVTTLLYRLPEAEQRIFAAECVEFVLPTYTTVYPQHENSLREYIITAHQYAKESERYLVDLETARRSVTSLGHQLRKEMSEIASKVWQEWRQDPRQREGPTPTQDESEDIPRSRTWLDTHLGILRSMGQVAAWWHASPARRMEYAKLADAYPVIEAARWLTMSHDFVVVNRPSNPRAKESIYSHTQKLGKVITLTASHRAERAAMEVIPAPPSNFVHYYGVGRGHGVGTPDPAATRMRMQMQSARREAIAVEEQWQQEKIEAHLAALKG